MSPIRVWTPPPDVPAPCALAIAPDGTLVVADQLRRSIWRRARRGRWQRLAVDIDAPRAIGCDARGRVYVLEGARVVRLRVLDERLETRLVLPAALAPLDLAVAPDGTAYVAWQAAGGRARVVLVPADGGPAVPVYDGEPGDGLALAMGPDATLWLMHGDQLMQLTPDGVKGAGTVPLPAPDLEGAGLAIDAEGRPVLALPLQGSVWRREVTGWVALWHGGGLSALAGGTLACPCAPVCTAQGVVVLDARSRELVWLRSGPDVSIGRNPEADGHGTPVLTHGEA